MTDDPTDRRQLTAAAVRAYIARGGTRCLYCDSDDIEASASVETDAGIAWQEIDCNSCGATRRDVYTLTAIAVLDASDNYFDTRDGSEEDDDD